MYTNGEEHRIGDLVKVIKGFWDHCSDDVCKVAVIEHTYASKYGGEDHDSLGLVFENGNKSAWWSPEKLELVGRDSLNLIEVWERDRKILDDRNSNFDFIFNNLDEIIDARYSASVQSMFSLLGGGSLWGSSGEGFTYQVNFIKTLAVMEEFSKSGRARDVESFLAWVEGWKSDVPF